MSRRDFEISLYETILEIEGIEFALFDKDLSLVFANRTLTRGLSQMHPTLTSVIPELAGMEDTIRSSILQGREIFIPRLNRSRAGQTEYVDLRLLPHNGQLLAILKNSTQEGILEQKLTQQRNEMVLLNRELEKSYRSLSNLSGIDELTQLFNRNAAHHIFRQKLENARKYQQPLNVVFLDLDNLKQINDNYGHADGDRALQFLASTLRELVRAEDAPARWGGDEFVVLLHGDAYGARRVAHTLLEQLARTPCSLSNGRQEFLHISIGICHVPVHVLETITLEEILAEADRAMYISKQSGGDRVTEVRIE